MKLLPLLENEVPLEYDDEPGSWGRMSKDWPEITFKTEAAALEAYQLCHTPKRRVPYGSYVLMCDADGKSVKLRFENDEVLLSYLRE